MGLDDNIAHGAIRFGLGRFTTEEEIDYAISMVERSVNELRKISAGF